MRSFRPALADRLRALRPAGLPLACLLCVAGCYSSRDTGELGPGAASDPLGEGQAQGVAVAALRVVNDMLLLLPDWTSGQLGGIGGLRPPQSVLSSTSPAWNDSEHGWLFSDSLVSGVQPSVSYYRYKYGVQYNRCERWQREARGADQMWLNLDLLQKGHGQSDGSSPESYTVDYTYHYWLTADASQLREPLTHMQANGGLTGDYLLIDASGGSHSTYTTLLRTNISVAAGGCPRGTVTVDVDPFVFTAVYNGTPQVRWTLTRGADVRASGTISLNCGGSGRPAASSAAADDLEWLRPIAVRAP